jgi:hypothetical protein
VEFTTPTSLILNVGPRPIDFIGEDVSDLKNYRIKAINVDVPSNFAYVDLKINVLNECTSTTLT